MPMAKFAIAYFGENGEIMAIQGASNEEHCRSVLELERMEIEEGKHNSFSRSWLPHHEMFKPGKYVCVQGFDCSSGLELVGKQPDEYYKVWESNMYGGKYVDVRKPGPRSSLVGDEQLVKGSIIKSKYDNN
jgi:hypothetical protein